MSEMMQNHVGLDRQKIGLQKFLYLLYLIFFRINWTNCVIQPDCACFKVVLD